MKLCKRCNTTKPLDDFPKASSRPDGRYSLCRACKYVYMKRYDQIKKYGMTTEDALQITQKCHICSIDLLSVKKICIDHDHQTKKVRGVLCNTCNAGLGMLGDSREGLERALRYLNSPPLY